MAFVKIKRAFQIWRVLRRHQLGDLIPQDNIARPLRFVLRLLLPTSNTKTAGSSAERTRLALETLGPIFIKFGQALSTRPDILDAEMASELAKLQDDVPPFDGNDAVALIEESLGGKISDTFTEFDIQPLASASIAQVHEAKLSSGLEVVIKVIRPNIEKTIAADIALMQMGARWVDAYIPNGYRLRPVELVEDYRSTILDELDLKREAANTSQLRRNFLESDLLYVPEVYFDYSNTKVLVMEKIYGTPIGNIDELRERNINMKCLAERGVEIFFTQVFRDNFFHADMHPGNVFVSHRSPDSPSYIGIDCAIIGSLTEHERYYLARCLLSMFERDYQAVAELYIESGWISNTTKAKDFESAIRAACEPIFEKPIAEIAFGQLLVYLFQTAQRFDMQVQPSLVLLQKTLLNVEGLGRQLYPQLDLWETAKPFLDQWIKDRYLPSGLIEQLRKHAPQWLEQLPQVPDLVLAGLSNNQRLAKTLSVQNATLTELAKPKTPLWSDNAVANIILLTGVLWASSVLIPGSIIAAVPVGAWVLVGAGVLLRRF